MNILNVMAGWPIDWPLWCAAWACFGLADLIGIVVVLGKRSDW